MTMSKRILSVVVVFVGVWGTASAWAANRAWINPVSAPWDDTTTANWSGDLVPVSGDPVFITNAFAANVDVDYASANFTGANAVSNLTLGNLTAGKTNSLLLGSGDTLQLNGNALINTNGRLVVDSGALFTNISATSIIIDKTIVNGVLELIDGFLYSSSQFAIRNGTYTQTGGTNKMWSSLRLGDTAGENATLNMSGGVVTNTGYDLLARAGNSTLNLSGGEINITRTISLGIQGGTHNWTVSGGSLTIRANNQIGVDGLGSTNGVGTVTITQTGGLVKFNILHMFRTSTYDLQAGAMTNVNGTQIDGTFTQSSGTQYNGGDVVLGTMAGRTGTYTMVNGTFRGRGLSLGRMADSSGTFTMSGGSATIANSASGPDAYFTIGADSGSGSGTLVLKGATFGSGAGAFGTTGMLVNATGVVRGHGAVSVGAYRIAMGGRIIADGEGVDATLNLSSFSSVSNYVDNVTDKGWYATNHGKLLLPKITINTATNIYNWGEQSDDTTIDLVNSARFEFTGLTGSGSLTGAVLAVDRPEAYVFGNPRISVHEFAMSSGPSFTSCKLTIRYDDSVAPGREERMVLNRWTGTDWVRVPITVDTGNHWVTATGLTALGRFSLTINTVGTLINLR